MSNDRQSPGYVPALWEKIVAYSTAVLIVLFVIYLLYRNEPFQDPNLVIAMRTILSLAIAVIGAVVPGFLAVDLRFRGFAIRAGSALALFVITYCISPTVLPSLRFPPVLDSSHYPPESIINKFPDAEELVARPQHEPTDVSFSYKNNSGVDLRLFVYDFGKRHSAPPDTLGTPIYWQAWRFPADGEYQPPKTFTASKGWFGFAVGWLPAAGGGIKHQYLETKNIFYSETPALVVTLSEDPPPMFDHRFIVRNE